MVDAGPAGNPSSAIAKKLRAFQAKAALTEEVLMSVEAADLETHASKGLVLDAQRVTICFPTNGSIEALRSLPGNPRVVTSWKDMVSEQARELVWFSGGESLKAIAWLEDMAEGVYSRAVLEIALCARALGGYVVDAPWVRFCASKNQLVKPLLRLAPAIGEARELILHRSIMDATPWLASIVARIVEKSPPEKCRWVVRQRRKEIKGARKAVFVCSPSRFAEEQAGRQRADQEKRKGRPLDPQRFLTLCTTWVKCG
jgi:hypothetical protein